MDLSPEVDGSSESESMLDEEEDAESQIGVARVMFRSSF